MTFSRYQLPLLSLPLLLGLAVLLTQGPTVQAAESSLQVDDHWLDIFQQNEENVLLVKETLWFNNTGPAHYNDTLSMWMPPGAAMTTLSIAKVDLTQQVVNTTRAGPNLLVGEIFADYGPYLTYFGEQADLELIVEGQNSTLSLPLTMALDTPRASQPIQRNGSDLRFTAAADTVTTNLGEVTAIPETITYLYEELRLSNEGTHNRSVNLSVRGVPAGWKAWMFEVGNGSDNFTLAPGETVNLTLHLRIPSYLIKLELEYGYRMELTGSKLLTGHFEKRLVHETRNLEFYVFTIPGSTVTMSDNLQVAYHNLYEPYDREWYIGRASDLDPQGSASLSISWKPAGGDDGDGGLSTSWVWGVGILVIVLVFTGGLVARGNLLANLTALLTAPEEELGMGARPLPGEDEALDAGRARTELEELDERFRLDRLSEREYLARKRVLEERLRELETGELESLELDEA